MTPAHPLVLGLGGFGRETLRQFAVDSAAHGRLWIDQKAEVLFVRHCSCGYSNIDHGIHALGLLGEEAREALLHLEDWQAHHPWLPERNRVRWLSELGTRSTSGFRVLGRMSLTRSNRVLDAALRKAAAGHDGVQRHRGGDRIDALPPREVFLIASAEGGTGSAILTDITLLLRRLLPRATFHALLLVPPIGVSNRRRFEAAAFASLFETAELYREQTYRLSFEGETAEVPLDPKAELWQRIFLFRTAEQPPYQETAKEVAEALELLIDPQVAAIRGQWPEARVDSDTARGHPFSAGGGFHGRFPFSREKTRAAEPERAVKVTNSDGTSQSQISMDSNGGQTETDHNHCCDKQVELWNSDLDRLYEAFRSLRFSEQKLAHQKLWQIEKEILAKVADRVGPLDGEPIRIEQHIKDLRTLHGESAEKAPPLKRRVPLWRNFLFEQRINIARKLLEALVIKKPEERRTDDHRSKANGASKVESEEVQTSESFETTTRTIDEFTAQLEKTFTQPVFNAFQPEEARRLRAALLVPPEIEDPEPWASALRLHLGVEPEIHRCRSGSLRVWWEDLYHPLKSIECIQALASAYLATPERPLLHTDRAFQPKAEAWAEAHRS